MPPRPEVAPPTAVASVYHDARGHTMTVDTQGAMADLGIPNTRGNVAPAPLGTSGVQKMLQGAYLGRIVGTAEVASLTVWLPPNPQPFDNPKLVSNVPIDALTVVDGAGNPVVDGAGNTMEPLAVGAYSSLFFFFDGSSWTLSQKGALQGATGATGAPGPAGPQGATGATGAQGPVGPAGATGPQGREGRHGRHGTDRSRWRHGTDRPGRRAGASGGPPVPWGRKARPGSRERRDRQVRPGPRAPPGRLARQGLRGRRVPSGRWAPPVPRALPARTVRPDPWARRGRLVPLVRPARPSPPTPSPPQHPRRSAASSPASPTSTAPAPRSPSRSPPWASPRSASWPPSA